MGNSNKPTRKYQRDRPLSPRAHALWPEIQESFKFHRYNFRRFTGGRWVLVGRRAMVELLMLEKNSPHFGLSYEDAQAAADRMLREDMECRFAGIR